MPRSPFFVAATVLLLACDETALPLPQDAARPAARPQAPEATNARNTSPAPAPDEPDQPAVEPQVERAPTAFVESTVRPLLGERQLAHRVYRGHFGPSLATTLPTAVVLTRGGVDDRLGGFAHDGKKRYDFPPLHDGDALDLVAAVLFRDVDEDLAPEVIALIAYHDEDPDAAPYFSNVVLDWDARRGRFVRRASVEGELEACANASQVMARLARLSPP